MKKGRNKFFVGVAFLSLLGLVLSPLNVSAATTIGANISTNGNLTADGSIKFTSGAGAGLVLTSDVSGNASWAVETDPVFGASPAGGILGADITNWNTAFGWGDHSLAGYLTVETDPVFGASPAGGILGADITNWNTAFGWGDHSLAGYLTVETDPVFGAAPASGILGADITNWNTAFGWGNHSLAGYLTVESDPVAGAVNGIVKSNGAGVFSAVTDNSANWNTAFGWGNHAGLYTPLAHKTTEDAINGLVKVDGAGNYSQVTDNSGNWNTAYGWGNHATAGYLTSYTETDPQVNTLTAGQWCTTDGSVINCTSAAPSGAPVGATYITQTADGTLTNEQALSALATGLVKNTTGTGVLSIASAGTDYENPLTFSAPLSRAVNTISITADSIGDTELAFNTGQNLTTSSSPTFTGLTLNSVAYTWPGTDGSSGDVLSTNGSGTLSWVSAGGSQNLFETINAPSGTDPVADSATDTLNLTAGTGLTITGNSGIDTVDFSLDSSASPTFAGLTLTGFSGVVKASAGVLSASSVNLASEVTGTLPYNNGGTGQSSYAQGDMIYASAANTLSKLTVGTNGQCLTSNGTIPAWGSCGSGSLPAGTTNDSTLRYNTGDTSWKENTAFLASSAGTLTIAAGQSYTGAGAVTLSSGAATALTITSNAAATWKTATGALTVDSAAALNLGTSTATSVSIGKAGVLTTVNDGLTVTGTTTLNGKINAATGGNNPTGTGTINDAAGTGIRTVTIANTSVTANSLIFITPSAVTTDWSSPYISAKSAGVSFTVAANDGVNANINLTFQYLIIN
jgi:hypothetical protein